MLTHLPASAVVSIIFSANQQAKWQEMGQKRHVAARRWRAWGVKHAGAAR